MFELAHSKPKPDNGLWQWNGRRRYDTNMNIDRMQQRAQTLLVIVCLLGMAAVAQGQAGGQANDVQGQVAAIAAAHHGSVAVYARDFNTGQEVSLSPNEVVQTASVIKLGILYEAMEEVRAGKAKWDERITMPAGYAVGGSGMLTFFDAPMQLTLKDVLTMMVVVSDNTATDLAIDRFTVKAVNDRMMALGLKNTWLYKRISKPAVEPMPADQPKWGLGKTTPREMAELLTDIGECKLHQQGTADGVGTAKFAPMDEADQAVCNVAMHMLRNQFYRETIPRFVDTMDTTGEGNATASKTGSLNAVRNDVALVAGKSGPMVISVFTYDNVDHSWTVDNEGEMTIAKIGRAIVQAWSPAGLNAKAMMPGLGLTPVAAGTVK
jgi:beta-lactamase class A